MTLECPWCGSPIARSDALGAIVASHGCPDYGYYECGACSGEVRIILHAPRFEALPSGPEPPDYIPSTTSAECRYGY